MIFQVVLSFGRISILEFFIIVFGAFAFRILAHDKNKMVLKGFIKVIFITVAATMIMLVIIPDSVIERFMVKVTNSFEEINTDIEILSVEDAMRNWRAYEMQEAISQWTESGVGYKIFGKGVGSGISLKYIPYTWTNIGDNNQIPILHNGFYTILVKGGLVGLLSILFIFFGAIGLGYRLLKSYNLKDVGALMISINIACMACTYVVRGLVEKGGFFAWGIISGSFLSFICIQKRNSIIIEEGKK